MIVDQSPNLVLELVGGRSHPANGEGEKGKGNNGADDATEAEHANPGRIAKEEDQHRCDQDGGRQGDGDDDSQKSTKPQVEGRRNLGLLFHYRVDPFGQRDSVDSPPFGLGLDLFSQLSGQSNPQWGHGSVGRWNSTANSTGPLMIT